MILLLSIFIGTWLAELVNVMKYNAPYKYLWECLDNPNLNRQDLTQNVNDLNNEDLNSKDKLDYN
jgi:hypothetical protein